MSEILYRPNLTYEKDYSTQGKAEQISSPSVSTEAPDFRQSVETLTDAVNRVKSIITLLPDDIYEAVRIPLAGVEYVVGTIGEPPAEPPKDIDLIVNPPKSVAPPKTQGPSNGILPPAAPLFSDVPSITLTTIKKTQAEIQPLRESYDKAQIFNDYLKKLQDVLGKFLTNLFVVAQEANVSDVTALAKPFEANTANVKDINLKHLSDTIIRSQVVRDQKLRLYTKLYDVDETVMHIRAIRVASKLRERYFAADYRDNNSMLSLSSNTMLSDARMAYDKKYRENLFGLYKYLNSSVILLNECLALFLQEAQAKAILMKEEGIK